MKRIFFTIIALITVLVTSAQTIKVYEYDDNGNLSSTPTYTSSKKVKVIFTDEEEHEYVDLGLPSGTLWATCNVGANTPEEYGDHFAWGETVPKEVHDWSWSTYKWCNGSSTRLNKYCTDSSNGTVDNKTELDQEDDAATVSWGSEWCMPSSEQIKELYNSSYTTTEWTILNGVDGRKITSKKNGKTLFLPAAGYHINSIYFVGGGGIWSRSLHMDNLGCAYCLIIRSDLIGLGYHDRCYGYSVRPVRVKK